MAHRKLTRDPPEWVARHTVWETLVCAGTNDATDAFGQTHNRELSDCEIAHESYASSALSYRYTAVSTNVI